MANVQVHFDPLDQRFPFRASGTTDESGEFVLWTGVTEGCFVGRYRVTLRGRDADEYPADFEKAMRKLTYEPNKLIFEIQKSEKELLIALE